MQTVQTMDKFIDVLRREHSKSYRKTEDLTMTRIQNNIQQELDMRLPHVFQKRSRSTQLSPSLSSKLNGPFGGVDQSRNRISLLQGSETEESSLFRRHEVSAILRKDNEKSMQVLHMH